MIIGFSGFARAGKNTAAEEFAKLTEAECKHFAFARTLKQDLQPCIDALGAFADKASFKGREYSCNVIMNEAYTSKTYSKCECKT